MLHWVLPPRLPSVPSSRAQGLPGLCCPRRSQSPGAGSVARGSRPWALGRTGPQDRHEGPAARPLHSPCLATPPTLTAPAVQLRWGLRTSGAGGRAAVPGLCLELRGSLLLPPPALPEPGPALPAHRSPLSSRQAEAGGPPCQRPGTSLNPHPAGTPPSAGGGTSGLLCPCCPWSLRGQIPVPHRHFSGGSERSPGWGASAHPCRLGCSPRLVAQLLQKSRPWSPRKKPCPCAVHLARPCPAL